MFRLLSACLFLLSLAFVARAQEPTADQLIEHGVALREDGRDEEALAIFHRAYDTSPSPQAMAQIALAEHALGRLVDAETHLVLALESTTDRFVRRNRELLEQALVEMRAQLTTLTLTGGVEGAEVTLDDVVRGTMPVASTLRVQAGTVRVHIRAPGYVPFARTVIVEAGTPVVLDVALEPEPARVAVVPEPVVVAPEPPPRASSPDAWRLPAGIALAAAGGVGIAIASGLMAWREDNAQARLSCSDTDPACRARYGTAVDAETAGIASYVVSGLVLAAGVGLVVWDVLDASHDDRAIACAPGLFSFGCAGRFD